MLRVVFEIALKCFYLKSFKSINELHRVLFHPPPTPPLQGRLIFVLYPPFHLISVLVQSSQQQQDADAEGGGGWPDRCPLSTDTRQRISSITPTTSSSSAAAVEINIQL